MGVACTSPDPASHPPMSSTPKVTDRQTCADVRERRPPTDYRPVGKMLRGDVDGDGRIDRVRQHVSSERPKRCRWLLVVETARRVMSSIVQPVPWASTDPRLRMLAEIDSRRGREIVVSLSLPPAVYRAGAVFTVRSGRLLLMRHGDKPPEGLAHVIPFYDEVPAGVDCSNEPGEIVETSGIFAPGGDDSKVRIIRVVYEARGVTFMPIRRESILMDCCDDEVSRRWPETADRPFRSCRGRVS